MPPPEALSSATFGSAVALWIRELFQTLDDTQLDGSFSLT